EATSIFRAAIDASGVLAAAAPPSALHVHLYRVLRTSPPAEAVVAPIFIKERVVNLLYGHREGERRIGDPGVASLTRLTQAAQDAYVRLIARQKRAGSGG